MRSWFILSLLCGICAFLQSATAQCDLSKAKDQKLPFPDIEKLAVESFQMSVEYTNLGGKQTDYYTEYYDLLMRRGRVDIHQAGKSSSFLYKTFSWEAWELSSTQCKLQNITDTPNMFKNDQNDWLYLNIDAPERRTFGPSAMFKKAYDAWSTGSANGKMGYMGKAEEKVRGMDSHYWRRCDSDTSYVDYYFAIDGDGEDPFGLAKGKKIPLRVFFGGTRAGRDEELSKQQFEIMSFQPYISLGKEPFILPKGRGCRRGYLENPPTVPDFSATDLQFQAEVIYRKVDINGQERKYWTYYSTLFLAVDIQSQHVAYYYTPWEQKTNKKDDEPEAKAPVFEIYDMKHHYLYKYALDTGACNITRTKTYTPKYVLPEKAGAMSLMDPSILYPNSEFSYVSEGSNRGLKVNIFEELVEGYLLLDENDNELKVPRAYITRSYLKDDEVERNSASVKNALTQIQLIMTGRNDNINEMVLMNFFGFTTELTEKRNIFNVKRCYKNDDDYTWVVLGFNADPKVLQKIKNDIPAIQSNLLNDLQLESELNAVRVPIIQVDLKDQGVYASLLILSKPPVMLDYLDPENGKTIISTQEVEGVEDLNDCAKKCMEAKDSCWGFSICGAVCSFGTLSGGTVQDKKDCNLYRRFDNNTFIVSKEMLVESLRREVEQNQVHLMLPTSDDNRVQLDCTSIEVNDPGEDDEFFDRIGNKLNPRMRVLKTGYKLKQTSGGRIIKNMGKLRYDQCQRICLDFKPCETLSYCLSNSECYTSFAYGEDTLSGDLIEENPMCNILTRKYADHFNRSPGNVLSFTAEVELPETDVEGCARACLKQDKFTCLSFDHCPTDEKTACKLHTHHFPNPKQEEAIKKNATNCGHYYKKFSTEFTRNLEKRTVAMGSTIAPLANLTLEECAKACVEAANGSCSGYDFCQDSTILATSCTLMNTDPSEWQRAFSPICTNYEREFQKPKIRIITEEETKIIRETNPYSNAYSGGIGFLCFVVGCLGGALIVFGIAYFRVNRRQ